MKIGILGSSFNPAHAGHLKLSLKAIEIFNLDEVWWLITKQNPLKNKSEYLPFDLRVKKVENLITNEIIKLKIFEDSTESIFLIDNLKFIKKNYTNETFIFLMGSDSFCEMDQWRDYENIFKLMPIAVFNRNEEKYQPLASVAAKTFDKFKKKSGIGSAIFEDIPAWTFIDDFNAEESSTMIRNK